MRPFLQEVAEALKNFKPDNLTVVFPNQRSILYFRKYFSQLFDKPVLGPDLRTFEEFAASQVSVRVPDRLTLIYRLYQAYQQVTQWNESFDAFYYWGNMLLRDFDEIDKHLVEAQYLFRNLSDLKELDQSFDYLTEEQKAYLAGFWQNYNTADGLRTKFSEVWQHLYGVYEKFNELLQQEGLAYEGRMLKAAAEAIVQREKPAEQVVFVGFNALTPVQEKIITHAVEAWDAKVYWDADDYYVNAQWHEAGYFFRKYREHKVLKRTFPQNLPAHLHQTANKKINIYGTPQAAGQAKILAQLLHEALSKGMQPEEAVIVLPDEKMLLPVLHAISDTVAHLNVSVSYPLKLTPVPVLVELMARLQKHYHGTRGFYSPAVVALLSHPYLRASATDFFGRLLKEIAGSNRLYVPVNEFSGHDLGERLFIQASDIIAYISNVLTYLQDQQELSRLDVEYLRQALRLVHQLAEIPEVCQSWDAFLLLFRQLTAETRIPFVGEPLKGLPVIGMLETRNLDFRHVFMLSVNEGFIPPSARAGTYLPYNLRRAYNLPVSGHDEAISAYLFYRLMQRAETINFFYTTEPDELGGGEMSRFLQQVILEIEPRPKHVVFTNNLNPVPVRPLAVEKTDEVMQQLLNWQAAYNGKGPKSLSPSLLYTYIECRLKFYFKHVLRLHEANKVEETLSARLTGNILHGAMKLFYEGLMDKKGNRYVEPADLKSPEKQLDEALHLALQHEFKLLRDATKNLTGHQRLTMEVMKHFALRILKLDRQYAPFEILALESSNYNHALQIPGVNVTVYLGGQVDRIDKKDNTVRILDYKTGGDQLSWQPNLWEKIFNREDSKGKAAFQTMFYALLFARNTRLDSSTSIRPGIMGRKQIFADDFVFGLKEDVRADLDEFEARLKEMLGEVFNSNVPFNQTQNTDICKFCSFKDICHR
jgi:hypothetical protein